MNGPSEQQAGATPRLVTLLTDFGTRDPYVGIMKGVLHTRAASPCVTVDLGHEIAPQDVHAAAFQLAHSRTWFPPGTVHVCVVDPGVGSARRILAAADGGQFFLAPDNGLLGPVIGPDAHVVAVDIERHGLSERSRTFHGRDVFMPVAAKLVDGHDLDGLGAPAGEWKKIPMPAFGIDASVSEAAFTGEVLLVDRFGNLITNLPAHLLDRLAPGVAVVAIAGREVPVRATYAEVDRDEVLALVDSYGLLEVAQRDGDAARFFDVTRGAAVRLYAKARAPQSPEGSA